MEKYKKFADGGTGVNPFVPWWASYRSSAPVRGLKGLVMLPFAALRLALFSVSLLWLALAQLICCLIPLGVLRYPVYRLLTWIGCVVALLALGVVPIGESVADHRRLKLAPPKAGGSAFDARRGTLIIANHQGLTDVLYLCMKVCPTFFVFPAASGVPVVFNLLGALSRAGARRPAAEPCTGSSQSLAQISEKARSGWRGPVVVFAEGARTNGVCVLNWKAKMFEGLESVEKPVGTALVGLEYSKAGAYTPHHTIGTSFRHIFWLCMQPWHTLSATWLPASEVAAAIKTKGAVLQDQVNFLRTILVRMIPAAVEVDISADRHVEFIAFWDASQKKGYTKTVASDRKAR